MRRAPVLVVAALFVASGGLALSGAWSDHPAASPPPSGPDLIAASPGPTSTHGPDPSPTTTAAPTAADVDVAIVPVTHFRATVDATTAAEVADVLAGRSDHYSALELVAADADPILARLGLTRPTDASRLVLAADPATARRDLAADRKRLAFLRADDVDPSVRALAWDGAAMFGIGRVAALAAWPLHIEVANGVASPANPVKYDPAAAWTLFAGGDILLDRGVAKTVKVDGKGVDFPFDGGTAEITSRYCCSSFGWELPKVKRTGGGGAVRAVIAGADIALANFENPAPDAFRYHTSGTVFSADPKLIAGLAGAGIDVVSLANNHIRDAGAKGILDTIRHLDASGIRHAGAGKDLATARTPALLDAGGVTVAILGYDTIAKSYGATATRAGSAQLSAAVVKEDVAAARAAGADVVIVFPHWGAEYDPTPFAGQQKLARACIDAGADMVIGNHAHWAGAMEVYEGKPIWYALGNFVFDQTWSEPTMEGITLELTFAGARLVQVHIRPHVILDKSQPNFLDPAGSGKVVMGQVFAASKGLLAW